MKEEIVAVLQAFPTVLVMVYSAVASLLSSDHMQTKKAQGEVVKR
jgi:hypothetical protein